MLAFETEAMERVDIGVSTHRVLIFNSPKSYLIRRLDVELIKEVREDVELRVAYYQERTSRFYNRRVKPTNLKEGDYVLKKVVQKVNKLEENWHGPYRISAVVRPRTYRIETLKGE